MVPPNTYRTTAFEALRNTFFLLIAFFGANILALATATELPDATDGVAYNYQLHFPLNNALTPYKASVTAGALPQGVDLKEDRIVGTPKIDKDQEYNFTITVTDSSAVPQKVVFDYHIHGVPAAAAPALPIDLPDASNRTVYSYHLRFQLPFAPTTPITAKITTGTLPSGLDLKENGQISGTPEIKSDQDFPFTVTVKDSSPIAQTTQFSYRMHGMAASATAACVPAVVANPSITSSLTDGTKEVSGTASDPPAAPAGTNGNCKARVDLYVALASDSDARDLEKQTDGKGNQLRFLLGTADVSGGKFDVKLTSPIYSGQRIFAVEVFGLSTGGVETWQTSNVVNVAAFGNWGLVKAYFTSGLLLSQDAGSFSQSNLFLSFVIDKTWRLPGYYHAKGDGKGPQWIPGINSFFETRLTAIPVTSCALPNGASNGTAGGSGSSTTTVSGCTNTTTGDNLSTFLATRKTARLQVGSYLPLTVSDWTYRGTPNTLFLAPIAKLGFDTPAGTVSQAQPSNTGTATAGATVTPLNSTNFYTFYSFGGRFGHYAMTSKRPENKDQQDLNDAPEIISYLDFMIGRFSNLESLVPPTKSSMANCTNCPSRQRLWRVSVEGILKIPSTPLIVGFNANVGMANPGAPTLKQRAGDDLRFLFGARFDVGKLLAKVTEKAP
jgi:hypothetical protein